ncbi:MAG: hypothetical protein HWE27_14610 [Gammaproteobacteria bacterium]|nr:hypothetical protein [Gammaproteobacteria bacterium]
MLYQQIPALFYSLQPRFEKHESVRITQSQYVALNQLITDYCYAHDAPRLKSLAKLIQRRMDRHAEHHLWHAEFDYISSHMLSAMKESGYCRNEDNAKTVAEILNRNSEKPAETKRHNRNTDPSAFNQSVKSIFDRWLH